MEKWAKSNMKVIQEADLGAMSEYCIQDVELTYKLFEFFCENSYDRELIIKYSALAHVCNSYRDRGVVVDLDRAREVQGILVPMIKDAYESLFSEIGYEFNTRSSQETGEALLSVGVKCPKDASGKYTVQSKWLQESVHPACRAVYELRKLTKASGDYIKKVIDMQKYTCPDADRYGMLYPELNVLEARTGRFSCRAINIQQIPSRDEVLGPLCRSIYVPHKGTKWYSLDYSNQEGRLQIHYASKSKCVGAEEVADKFRADPNYDMHQEVADLAGLSRSDGKAINLGLSYGMGIKKMSSQLNKSLDRTKQILNRYKKKCPYLPDLIEKCQRAMETRGYIVTIGGRRVYNDPPIEYEGKRITFEYKALNKLIQGSAADQTIEAMLQAYATGIPVLFPVHDELCMSGNEEHAKKLFDIMVNCTKLTIPTVVSCNDTGASNWAEAK